MTTTVRPTPGFLLTTTLSAPVTQMTQDCVHDDKVFADGALIKTEKACEHCYCMKGDIVCVVQECGTPMENEGKNCTSLPPREGQCCPDTYICEGDEIATEPLELFTTETVQDELTTLIPPRRHGIEGSGYRKEPDDIIYTATPPTEPETEGSGYEQKQDVPQDSYEILSTTVLYESVPTKAPITDENEHEKEKEITEEVFSERPQEEYEKTTTVTEKHDAPSTTEEVLNISDEKHELDQGLTNAPTLAQTELATKPNKEEFIYETTQKEVSIPEQNSSTISSELGTQAKVTTEIIKQDLGTTINIEENDISITTSSTIFEEGEGVTTDREHEIVTNMVSEKEKPQIGEYSPSTSSTPFLEEVEKVTTQTQEQHIVTDNISETESFEPHKFASTSVPEVELNKETDIHSGNNILPDTESHEYIPIATSAPIGDESEKRTTLQEDSVTSDFTQEEINKPHKYIPITTHTISEDNGYITTETNKESSSDIEIPKDSDAHVHISSTTGFDTTSKELTTQAIEYNIVTDKTKKEDDNYEYTLTTTSVKPTTEDTLVTSKEVDENEILSGSIETDKTITDKYISTTLSTPYSEGHVTSINDFVEVTTDSDSKQESSTSDKDISDTVELTSSTSKEDISTELNKYEPSTTKFEEKESYEPHKLHSTSSFGIEEDYITTTEYTGKDQEFISHVNSHSGTISNENMPDASSTPFLEEIEKATPEVSEYGISSTVGVIDIHTPEEHIPSTDIITKLDEQVTTIFESDNIIHITSTSSPIDSQNFDSVIPEKTTQAEQSKHETTIPYASVTDERQAGDMDSMTTYVHAYSTSSSNSFITKEDQFTVTTEPSYRKEDNYVQPTSESSQDITTSPPNTESSTITAPIGLPQEIPTISVLPEYVPEIHQPVSIDEVSIVSTTHALEKIDLFETSTINLGENEIHEDILPSAGRIPGEGDCLLNGVTYKNESAVPSSKKCHSGCKCLSSIISCDPIICSPAPEYMNNCQPTYDSPDSCCPTYVCDQVRETLPPLPYKHVTTPETPKQTIPIECHGDECEVSGDKKKHTDSELCSAGSCSTDFDHQQEINKCGANGCTERSQTSIQTSSEKSELCINGKCEQQLPQVPGGELCMGDNCKPVNETLPHGTQQDSKSPESSSMPCIGESCTVIQESINIVSEPHHITVPCNEKDGCTGNQDFIKEECTDDSCKRKEVINIDHTSLCSGVSCEKNQNTSDESTKNTEYSTYAPIAEQSTGTETPILPLSLDMATKPTEQHVTDASIPGDILPNVISENKEKATELPEIITTSVYTTDIKNDATTLPDTLISEGQKLYTDEPQKPVGDSHTVQTESPIMDEQQSSTEQPRIKVTEHTIPNTEYETSTLISDDMFHKEEEVGITIDQTEDNNVKLQDETITPSLPINEIERENTTPEIAISSLLDTNTRAPMKDEIVTTILNSLEHKVSTPEVHEYFTSTPTSVEVESGSTAFEQSPEISTMANSQNLLPITETIIDVTGIKEPSLNEEVTTSVKYETETGNDYTTIMNNLELEHINPNTDVSYSHISEHTDDAIEKLIPSAEVKPVAESYDTTTQQIDVIVHESTESVLSEKKYTDTIPIVTNLIDSGIHLTETDDTSTVSPVLNTLVEKLDVETTSSHVTEVVVDNERKTTLPTFEIHEEKIGTDFPSAITESEDHVPKVDISKTTLPTTTNVEENIEEQNLASLATESTFVTKKENTASDTTVASVTEVGIQKDKIDQSKGTSPNMVTEEGFIQPEITSLHETQSELPTDERKTTLKQEEDDIKTDSPGYQATESVVYATPIDEIKHNLLTTIIDKNQKIETASPSIYVTEQISHLTETEEIRTTISTLLPKEETMKPEYPSTPVTEKEIFTDEKETTLGEYITEQENIFTVRPSSQFNNLEVETTVFDNTRTTTPTLITEGNVEEIPDNIVPELKPHSDEETEIKATLPTYSEEEENITIQSPLHQVTLSEENAPITLSAFANTEQTIKEAIPISSITVSEAHFSKIEESSVTLPTYVTKVEKIKDEPELSVSSITVLGLHENKTHELNTILPEYYIETESTTTYVTESIANTNYADQTNKLPVIITEDKKKESEFTPSYVTESGVYVTDIDKTKSTLSDIVSEKQKLDSESPMSQVTESVLSDSQSPHVTEPEMHVYEMYDIKTTVPSSIIKEEKLEEVTTQVTQSVLFETETKIPSYVTEADNNVSEFIAASENTIEPQTNEVKETQTTQPESFTEEGKIKIETPISEVTDSEDHAAKLDEISTKLPASENENEPTETSYTQVTESGIYETETDSTRIYTHSPYSNEENKVETKLTTLSIPESEDHISMVEETRTTSPALSITEVEKTVSDLPGLYVTESEIGVTSTYTSLPKIENYDTEAPVYHIPESEAHVTIQDKIETTTPAFITVSENIKTEPTAGSGTESIGLITEMIQDGHKLTTLSENISTEKEVYLTELLSTPEIIKNHTINVNLEKEQDEVKQTTELVDTFTVTEPSGISKRPLTENTAENEYFDNVITGEEVTPTTESSKVEVISSVSISDLSMTQSDELQTKVPEEHQLSTEVTENTSIGDSTSHPQVYYTKLPELNLVTTISTVTRVEKEDTSSGVEDMHTPSTVSPNVYIIENQQAVTKDSEADISTTEELETQKQIDTEKQVLSTDLPTTIMNSQTNIPHHHDLAHSTISAIAQEEITSSEPEAPYKITLAPESLTTNLQEVSQTNLDKHHITEEDQSKIKPITDYIDSSTIKSETITISPEQYFTEKQVTISTERDSSPVSEEITTTRPAATEINTMTTMKIQETTVHEQIKHTSVSVAENTDTPPDVIELEEHTHKTFLEITTLTSLDDQSSIQSIPEKLEHQIPEQSTDKASDEQLGTKETTVLNEGTSTSIYEVEKTTVTISPVDQSSKEIQSINTTPVTTKQEETSTSLPTQVSEIENVSAPEASITSEKPSHEDKAGTTTAIDEITGTTSRPSSLVIEKESPAPVAPTLTPETKPSDTTLSELPKPVTSATQSPDEISPQPEEEHFPPSGSSGYGVEPDYVEEDQAFGPGTCRYGGKVYVSAQQIPRDDPCDFCFCFRSDIICLQQSCPPPIHGCHEEPIQGFCCPRYECPVSMATTLNVTTTTTTTTTTLPPHFPTHSYKGAAQRRGCQIKGHIYKVGEVVRASSGPCLHCT